MMNKNDYSDDVVKCFVEKWLENDKYKWFYEHIKAHLSDDQVVVCKICNKDFDTIKKEKLNSLLNDLKKIVKK